MNSDAGRSRIRIVVVERESIIRLDMSEILTAAGYEIVAQADSAAEAVALTLFLQPDLLVLDRALISPSADPIDRIQHTRFPLAVLETVCSMPRLTMRDRLSRQRVYLAKPFTERELLDAAEHALAGSRQAPRAPVTNLPAEPGVIPRQTTVKPRQPMRVSRQRSPSCRS